MDMKRHFYFKFEISGMAEPIELEGIWPLAMAQLLPMLREVQTRKDGSGSTHGTLTFSDSPLSMANINGLDPELMAMFGDIPLATPEQQAEWDELKRQRPWGDDPEFKQFQAMMVPSRYVTAMPGEVEGLQARLRERYGDDIESHIANRRA